MPRVPGLERLRVRVLAPGAVRTRVAIVVVLALSGAGIALTLSPSTALSTFVSSSSPDYAATQAMYRQFGSDPVVVLVRGPLTGLLSPRNITTLSRLEGCLGGQQLRLDRRLEAYIPVAAASASPYGGRASPCGKLMREHTAAVVYGPASFLNHAVAAVNTEVGSLTVNAVRAIREAEAAARSLARARGLTAAETGAAVQAAGTLALERELAATSGSTDSTSGSTNSTSGSPTATNRSASTTATAQALLAGVPSISDPTFLRQIVFGSATNTAGPSARFSYLFPNRDAGVIQVRLRAGLSRDQVQQAIGLIRAAVDRPEFRIAGVSYTVTGEPVLLSDLSGEISAQLVLLLAVAIVAMAIVLVAVFRRSLRLLPLATALAAVAITFGLTAAFGGTLTVADVAVFPVLLGLAVDYGVQLRSGTPRGATSVAAMGTAAGFLALLLSPVPMVRGFGLLLVVGVLIAVSLSAFAAPAPPGRHLGASRLVPHTLLASIYGAGEILIGWLPALVRHPRRVLALALVLAGAGWGLETRTAVQSDITKLVPADMPALRHLDALERATGTSGEVDVLVSARNVTSVRVLSWMAAYERQMTRRFGGAGASGCAAATLCPALSLPSLLHTAGGSLAVVPGYFQRSVLTPSHRYALLAFGIRLMPLSRQRHVVEQMREALRPRSGVRAQLAGAPVLAADAEGSLASSSDRLLMLALSLGLVAVTLLVALKRLRRMIVPLIPIALATGWSALLVYLLHIPLNPMSATLGTLVIAITTEFSVLLSERVYRAWGVGVTRGQALDAAYRTTGVAVLTSALAAIGGFAALTVSNITMLRDFGLLGLVDLSVSLVGVMVVLPATVGLIDLKPQPKTRPGPRSRPPRRPEPEPIR